MTDVKPSWIASTRKQALQIASAYDEEEIRQKIQNAFPTLGIVAFSGHVLDRPGSIPRFPPEAEEIAKTKMPDLTASDMDAAVKTIAGSARSMGIEVEGQ